MRKGTRNYEEANLTRVRELRRDSSVSEIVLWRVIRNNRLGFKFRRQFPVGIYVLDFYCAEANLAIEVDGEQHEHRKKRDAARDAWVAEQGIRTIRIPSLDLFEETSRASTAWTKLIVETCEERAGRSAFPD